MRRNVAVDEEFDEREERGEPPPVQEVVNRDLLIAVPDPIEDGADVELPPAEVEAAPEAARDWARRLERIDYDAEDVEITDVDIRSVTGEELGPDGWRRVLGAPDGGEGGDGLETATPDDLRQALRHWLQHIAEQATIEAGYPPHMQRHVHTPLRLHVCARFLDGQDIAFADEEALRRALRRMHRVEARFTKRHDIVKGMVEYAS